MYFRSRLVQTASKLPSRSRILGPRINTGWDLGGQLAQPITEEQFLPLVVIQILFEDSDERMATSQGTVFHSGKTLIWGNYSLSEAFIYPLYGFHTLLLILETI